MRISRLARPRSLVLLALLAIIAMAGFGFAAQNTVAPSSAGDGSGDITGYDVSAIAYTLNTLNPTVIDSVAFTMTGGNRPTTAKVQLIPTTGSWYSCVVPAGAGPWAVTCATASPVVTTQAAEDLRVVAAQ